MRRREKEKAGSFDEFALLVAELGQPPMFLQRIRDPPPIVAVLQCAVAFVEH